MALRSTKADENRWGRTPVLRPASTPAHSAKSLAAQERDVAVPCSSGELPHGFQPSGYTSTNLTQTGAESSILSP
jgi:hypothetical protein